MTIALEAALECHPEWPPTTDLYHSPLGLFDFQAEDIARAYLGSKSGGGNLVVWDAGTGKTHFGMRMSTLLAEDARDGIYEHDLTVLVCEKNKLNEWAEDFTKYTKQTTCIHHGTGRMKRLDKTGLPDVLITTYETGKADLAKFVRGGGKGKRGTSMVHGPLLEMIKGLSVLWVFDEMTKLRNRGADNYKAFDYTLRKMKKSHPITHRVFGLTATPIETGWENAFNECRLIRPDLMPTVGEFESYFVRFRDPFGRAKYHEALMGEFADMCAPIILRKRKTDPDVIAQFPKKVEEAKHLEMAPDQAALYAMVESLQDDQEDPVPGLWTALRQIAGSPASLVRSASHGDSALVKMLVQELGAEYLQGVSSVKEINLLEYLIPLVKGQGAKVVCFTFFGQTILPHLGDLLRSNGYLVYENHGGLSATEMALVRKAFRDDPQPCVFLTSDAGSRGVNLPEATYVIEYESALTFSNRTQRLDRIHRIDSKSASVTCMTFIVDRTVEVAIINGCLNRNDQQDVLLDDLDAGENFMTADDRREALQISRLTKPQRKGRK
jgi:SNF2 family DNA or RNA helicase